jgi:hypothetical protein
MYTNHEIGVLIESIRAEVHQYLQRIDDPYRRLGQFLFELAEERDSLLAGRPLAVHSIQLLLRETAILNISQETLAPDS